MGAWTTRSCSRFLRTLVWVRRLFCKCGLRNADCGFNRMNAAEMKLRTKRFALRVIRLVQSLPRDPAANVIGKQLIRSGTSVGANYRASCRAKSRADFVVKMNIVEEECDESLYWMELLIEAGLVKESKLLPLMT